MKIKSDDTNDDGRLILIFTGVILVLGIVVPSVINLYVKIFEPYIISAVVTTVTALFVLYFTIRDNNKTKKLSYMPSIMIEFGKYNPTNNEHKVGDDFTIKPQEELKKIIRRGNLCGDKTITTVIDFWWWEITLKNVGNGAAQSVSLSVIGLDYGNLNNLLIGKEESFTGIIYFPDNFKTHKIIFRLEYTDLVGNRYKQEHVFQRDGNNCYGSPISIS